MAELGNVAAMREALNQLRDWALLDLNENVIRSDEPNYKKLVDGIFEITNAALSAPARNCDRFATEREAWDFYLTHTPDNGNIIDGFSAWLYATEAVYGDAANGRKD